MTPTEAFIVGLAIGSIIGLASFLAVLLYRWSDQ